MDMNDECDDYPYPTALDDDNEGDLNSERKASGANPNYGNFSPNFYNPFEIKHRRRTSRGQLKILEKAFIENPKPNGKARQGLADSLSMPPRGVQVWFQNRRAKAKQQQQQQKKQQKQKKHEKQQVPVEDTASIVEDLEISINSCQYEPVILSASNMVHSRSQSSSSSSAYTCSDSLHPSYPTSFTMDKNNAKDLQANPLLVSNCAQNLQPWCSDASTVTGADDDDTRIISSSPFTPPVQSQVHINSSDQNLWMMEGALVSHQTLLNEQLPNAAEVVIGDDNGAAAAVMPKSDLFTTVIQDNNCCDTWAYNIDSNDQQFAPMSQAAVLQSVMSHADHHATRLIGNKPKVDDWIQTQDHILFDQIMDDSDDSMRRSSYPLEQDEVYWAGYQIMRRLSEPTQNPSELELYLYSNNTNSIHYNNYSTTIM